ncbi:MAG: YdbH domain-containing protein [Idiomarina sp.]|nr:YdbH domain-containing protein [Idiomarina sp.]
MRKILIVLSVLILLLAAAIGAAYSYVQYQLSQLPVENLNYRVAAVGYKHIRLAEVSFTYIEPARNVDALSSGFRSGEAALKAPVRLDDVFVTWQWRGFSPNLQIVEVGHVDFTLSHWPAAFLEHSEDAGSEGLSLPDDWRVTDDLPHHFEIKSFIVDLPCADRCYYSGRLSFSSDNKDPLLTTDEPQRTQLNLSLSPHQNFHEMEQLNIYVDYRVIDDLPELNLTVQSPMALNLKLSQQLSRTRQLSGELMLQLEPSAHWMFSEINQWRPQFEAQSESVLSFLSDSLEVNVSYHSNLPDTPIQRWANEIEVELTADITLQDQLFANFTGQLERDDYIDLTGSLDATIWPGLRANLSPLLAPRDPAEQSAFQADALLAQLESPVTLRSNWALAFPPGTEISSWVDQADGSLSFEFASDNEFVFDQFALMELGSQAEITLVAGMVDRVDLIVAGGLDLLTFNEQLTPLSIDPDRVHWSVHIDTEQMINWADLPVHVQAQSTGNSDITLDAQLRANIQSYIEQTSDDPLTQLAIRSQRGHVLLRQPELRMDSMHAHDIELELPFAMQFSLVDGLHIEAADTAHLRMALSIPMDEQVIQTPQLEVTLNQWQWHMPMADIADSRFSADMDVNAANVQAPAVLPINWRWFGQVSAEPLREHPGLQANGRLTNSAGLVLRQQLAGSTQQLTLDWQLADIFWLAGNPIAATLDGLWPELLTLERGRTRASGQIQLPLNNAPLLMNADLELLDVAGIYDTASFSGLRAQLSGRTDGSSFSVALDESYLQRLQYGMTHGPGELQLSYQGQWAAPLDGQLEVKANRLSVLNGIVSLVPAHYDLSQPEHIFNVDISQLDIARLLAEYPATDIQGSGLLSGSIPVRYSAQGIFVDNGRISALPPGGQLQYRSERARQMAQSNMAMGIVMDALDDFHYSALQGDVTYLEDGTLQLGLLVEGRNPSLEQGRPVRLEITVQEDLPALLASLQLTNQLNELIQERVQQRLIQGLRN